MKRLAAIIMLTLSTIGASSTATPLQYALNSRQFQLVWIPASSLTIRFRDGDLSAPVWQGRPDIDIYVRRDTPFTFHRDDHFSIGMMADYGSRADNHPGVVLLMDRSWRSKGLNWYYSPPEYQPVPDSHWDDYFPVAETEIGGVQWISSSGIWAGTNPHGFPQDGEWLYIDEKYDRVWGLECGAGRRTALKGV